MALLDTLIKKDIQDALESEPSLESHNINIKVENGIITLTGSVENYYEKFLAEETVKNIEGVKGVIEEVQVYLGEDHQRSDEDITTAALRIIEWDSSLPRNKITVTVEQGTVTLSGEVEWKYQRERAYQNVRYLYGVKNIVNAINLRLPTLIRPEHVSHRILTEFLRSASFDARNIKVGTQGDKVILIGIVRSWDEYEEARRAALTVPGVKEVDTDQLSIKV
ncbi:MAG: BON domain-containing protein [Alphaproteobacteria bacterium]|nr:BON domain-containing protein [Alphaproteobacteria bacterium]